jgi:hypothetical protein
MVRRLWVQLAWQFGFGYSKKSCENAVYVESKRPESILIKIVHEREATNRVEESHFSRTFSITKPLKSGLCLVLLFAVSAMEIMGPSGICLTEFLRGGRSSKGRINIHHAQQQFRPLIQQFFSYTDMVDLGREGGTLGRVLCDFSLLFAQLVLMIF